MRVVSGFKTWKAAGFNKIDQGYYDLPDDAMVMVRYYHDNHSSTISRGWMRKWMVHRTLWIHVASGEHVRSHYSTLAGYKVKPY